MVSYCRAFAPKSEAVKYMDYCATLMEDNSVSETLLNDSDTAGSTSNPMPVNPSICKGKCCDVVQPVQIRDKDAIQSTRKLQGKKWRQFSPDWYKSFPWLVLCTTRSKALCSYCSSCHRITD